MSTCPICDAVTSDPCGMGGFGDGPLPDRVKEYNKKDYVVATNEGDVDYWTPEENYNKRKVHSYSIERRYIMCHTCKVIERVVKENPEVWKKLANA